MIIIIEKFNCDKSFFLAIGNQVLKVIDYSVNNETIDTSFKIVCKSMRNRLTWYYMIDKTIKRCLVKMQNSGMQT